MSTALEAKFRSIASILDEYEAKVASIDANIAKWDFKRGMSKEQMGRVPQPTDNPHWASGYRQGIRECWGD